jgi:hypothetical protein
VVIGEVDNKICVWRKSNEYLILMLKDVYGQREARYNIDYAGVESHILLEQ